MKKVKIAAIGTAALALVFIGITAYYYFVTPPEAILVSAGNFPEGFSFSFTPNALIDHVVSHLQEVVAIADSLSKGPEAGQGGSGAASSTTKNPSSEDLIECALSHI